MSKSGNGQNIPEIWPKRRGRLWMEKGRFWVWSGT